MPQPEWLASCSRRMPTAKSGKNSTAKTRKAIPGSLANVGMSTIAAASKARKLKRKKDQYSGRPARPEKAAYLPRQTMMASRKLRAEALEQGIFLCRYPANFLVLQRAGAQELAVRHWCR